MKTIRKIHNFNINLKFIKTGKLAHSRFE